MKLYAPPGVRMKTGQYTGDGTISQPITGIGFKPRFVLVWPHYTIETLDATSVIYRSDNETGDLSIYVVNIPDTLSNRLISLDADGFTVDDNDADTHPNKSGQEYNYIVFG